MNTKQFQIKLKKLVRSITKLSGITAEKLVENLFSYQNCSNLFLWLGWHFMQIDYWPNEYKNNTFIGIDSIHLN